jgi:hypothetical protein
MTMRFSAVVVTLLLAGCGARTEPLSPGEMSDVRLRDVGELYRSHQLARKAPPKAIKDLAPFGNATPSGYEAIRSGEVIVRYGATLPDTAEEPTGANSDEVLAYAKEVPSQGGPVLMLDRRMKTMTADEFKSARLAGTN